MAGHPQGTPRGLLGKTGIDIGATSLTANSTGLIVSNGLRIGSKAVFITSNSTGVKLGSKYISTNTTGN